MKYVTGTLGAGFIFVATFVLCAWLLPLLPKSLHYWITIGPITINTNILIGLILAGAAAAASFKGTMIHYDKKGREKSESPPHN